jgi:hypothetical protein
MNLMPLAATADTAPAGGAAIGEIFLATLGATVITTALFALGWAHRTGRTNLLRRPAEATARATGLPVWAALPTQVASASLLIALFGMYWDISLHIDVGRDPGPLANPAHYFILAGLFGVFTAGFLAVVLPEGKPSRAAVRIAGDWYAPVAGIALIACAGFSLFGFPLDDVWHRLFGQDVTLWGPTHLMLIGGAGLALIGHSMLMVEGRTTAPSGGSRAQGLLDFIARTRYAAVAGGFLVGLSTFQAEFDFGVPQFRLLFQPVLIAVAAAIALVAARTYAGRGAALGAAAYFLAIRGLVALLVGPVLGQTTPHLPLYVVEAAMVEAAALAVVPTIRPYLFGAISGGLIGTVGFATEWAWSHVWMPTPWPGSFVGEAIVPTIVAAVAGGLVGAFVGTSLAAPRRRSQPARLRIAPAALGLVALIAVIGYGLDTKPAEGVRASVALHDVTPGPNRTVEATVKISPPSAARHADWLRAMAWQGGGFQTDRLARVASGVYRTTRPLPVHGDWKTLIRLQKGRSIVAVPVYMPADKAIPAPAVPARGSFQRPFVLEKSILQREQRSGVSPSLTTIAYAAVGSIALGLLLLLGWSLARLAGRSRVEGSPAATSPRPRPVPAEGSPA